LWLEERGGRPERAWHGKYWHGAGLSTRRAAEHVRVSSKYMNQSAWGQRSVGLCRGRRPTWGSVPACLVLERHLPLEIALGVPRAEARHHGLGHMVRRTQIHIKSTFLRAVRAQWRLRSPADLEALRCPARRGGYGCGCGGGKAAGGAAGKAASDVADMMADMVVGMVLDMAADISASCKAA
jgi:hypothetical protein